MNYLRTLLLCGCATVACSTDKKPEKSPNNGTAPTASLELSRRFGRSLDPQNLTVVDDSTWLATDRTSHDVWQFSIQGASIVEHKMWRGATRQGERPLAIAQDGDRIGILTNLGSLIVIDAQSGEQKRRIVVFPNRARLLGLYGARDGGWLLLEQRMKRSAAVTIDSLFLRKVDSNGRSQPLWSAEKSSFANVVEVIADLASATRGHAGLTIGLASPARIMHVRLDSANVTDTLVSLINSPRRRLSPAEYAQAQSILARPGSAEKFTIPSDIPAVTRAWPIPHGYVVLAASSLDHFAVDLYCGTSFQRTVMDSVADAVVLPGLLVIRSLPRPGNAGQFALYPMRQLLASCA